MLHLNKELREIEGNSKNQNFKFQNLLTKFDRTLEIIQLTIENTH